MSFHSDIISALRTEIATATGLTNSATSTLTRIYVGRQPRIPAPAGAEVWIKQESSISAALGAGHQDKRHRYTLAVRVKNLTGAAHTDEELVTTADTHADALEQHFNNVPGQRAAGLIAASSDFIACKADHTTTDDDPNEAGVIRSVVLLEIHSKAA